MSKWCSTCYRNEFTGEWQSCNDDCPVFGKSFDDLAKTVISNEIQMKNWNEEEVWEAIYELSDIKAGYNLFDAKERPKYHACYLAIKALREAIGKPIKE